MGKDYVQRINDTIMFKELMILHYTQKKYIIETLQVINLY